MENASKSTGGDATIDYVQFEGNVNSELETEDFSKNSSDLNKLAGVVILQDEVLLYAKRVILLKRALLRKTIFLSELHKREI